MKSYFTKFGAFLLCGVMLAAVGCHDYGEDIQQVNDKVDNLGQDFTTDIAKLESEIQTLKGEAATAIALQQAITDFNAGINGLKNNEIKTLQDQMAGKASSTDLSALATTVSDINTKIGALEGQFNDAIAGLDNTYATDAQLEAAVAAVNESIKKINDGITKINTALEGKADKTELEAVDKAVKDLTTTVNSISSRLDTAEKDIKDNAAKILGVAGDLDQAKNDLIAAIATAKNEAITEAQAKVDAAKAELTIAIATAKSEAVTEAQAKVDAAKAELTTAIATAKGEAVAEAQAKVEAAKAELTTAIATAKNEAIAEAQAKVDAAKAELTTAIATAKNEAIAEAQAKVDAAKAELTTAIATAKSEAVAEAQAKVDAAKAELTTAIATAKNDAIAAANLAVEAAKAELTTAIATAKNEAIAEAQAKVEAAKAELTTAIATAKNEAIAAAAEAAQAKVDAAVSTINGAITEINNTISALADRLAAVENKVAGLIQNIAFVPEYEDGLATAVTLEINGASVGVGNISATTLTGVFEVTPASQADAILALWNAEETKNEVSVIVQPVQTRAAAPITVNGVSLELSAVEGQEGRLAVTAYVPMIEDYTTYKFAFAVGTKATSDYVGICKKAGLAYSYDLVKDFDEAAGTATPVEDEVAYSHKWTQPADSDYDKEYKVVMLLDGKYYDPETVALKYGMAEDALTPELTVTGLEDGTSFIKLENGAIANVADAPGMYKYIGQTNSFKARYNLFGSEVLTHDYKYTITGVRFEDNTYYIDEADDLFWVADNEATVASLGADLFFNTDVDIKTDLARYNNVSTWKPVDNWNPIDLEQAIVDGNGKTVSNFAVEADANYAGLFGYIKGGTVKNITVADATVKAPAFVGAVVGGMDGTEEMTNCHAQNVTVTAYVDGGDCGNHAGAVAGYLNSDKDGITFDNITATGSRVYAYRDVAGLVGTADVKEIRNSRLATTVVFLDRRPAYGEVKDKNHNFLVGRVLEGANEVATTTTVDKASEWAVPVMNDGVLAANTESRLYEIHAYGAWLNVTNETQVLEVFNSNGLGFFSSKATEYGSEAKKAVRFTSDIDMSSVARGDDAAFYAFKPINNWVGEVPVAIDFDGCNRTIENLTINTPDAKNVAIFGHYSGDIKNVVVDNADLTGLGRVAGIAAQHWGKIEGCTVKNSTFVAKPANNDDGDKVGAIVAQQQDNTDAYILGCKVENVDIYGFRNLGAFAGHSEVTEFSNNTAKDVNIYIDQVTMPYGDYVPFATEHDFVGRNDNGVAIADEDTSNDIKVYNYEYTADEISDQQDFMTLREADKTLVTEVATVEALNLFAADHRNAVKFWTTFARTEINSNVRLSGDSYELTGLWKPVGSAFADCYLGTFNGNNKPITGLHVNTLEAAGFFGCVLGSVKNMNIIEPEIYSSHWGAAVVAVLYGEVDGCTVTGGQVVVAPNNVAGEWDNGDKAGAIAGYVAANGGGLDRVTNNTADGVTIKAFRSLGAIVGCMDNLDDDKDAFAGNVAKNCEVIVDRVTGVTDENRVNIGLVMGRFNDEDAADLETVKNGCTVDNVKLYKVTTTGTQALATSPKVGNNGVEVLN